MQETRHTTENGQMVFAGERLFDITATADDGQTESARIAADDEWKARTRLMAITIMKLRGQTVDYTVKEVALV